MDPNLPHELFATKGSEYILVLSFLLAFVLFWRVLGRRPAPAGTARPDGRFAVSRSGWFRLPLERFFHWGHGWAAPRPDGLVAIGVDDFTGKLVGPPESIDLPAAGSRIAQGQPMTTLRSGGKSVALPSPIAGEVIARNEALLQDPSRLGVDPYDDGWLLRIKPSRLDLDLDGLLQGRAAAQWLDRTEDALRERMSPSFGLLMQDGGVPVDGIARVLAGEDWDELAQDLLTS